MLKDAKGNRLFRRVDIRIVYPDNVLPSKTYSQHAEPRKGFGPEGIDDLLMQTADRLDTLYPWWEFKMIPLAPQGRTAKYVFTFAGYRAGSFPEAVPQEFTPEPTKEESSVLDPGVPEVNTPADAGIPTAVPVTSDQVS